MTTDTSLALAPWSPPHPRELPEWRLRMHTAARDSEAMLGLAGAINGGKATVFPVLPDQPHSVGAIAAPLLMRLEERRLGEAALYYASTDMCALALAAASCPPAEPFDPARLPAPSGLMVFESPIGGYTEDLAAMLEGSVMQPSAELVVSVPIVAVAWSHWSPADVRLDGSSQQLEWLHRGPDGLARIPADYEGVWLTFYTPVEDRWSTLPKDTVLALNPHGEPIRTGDLAAWKKRQISPLNWDNEMLLTPGAHFAPDPGEGTIQQWGQVVYTCFQLISQGGRTRLAEVEQVPRDRAGRRRDARAGVSESVVRVVDVHGAHRPPAEAASADAAASSGRAAPQWSCRWPVAPYRRMTCLNPRAHSEGGCTHEERIVPAHIKGPADKPLRTGETVHLWDHQPEHNPTPDPTV